MQVLTSRISTVHYFFAIKVVYWWTKCSLLLVLSTDCGVSYKRESRIG